MAAAMPWRAAAAAVAAAALAASCTVSLAMLPTHSWDTVGGGVFWHSCNFSGAFTDASLEVMTRFPMVTVEKGQGLNESPAATAAETKIVAALRQVKEYAAAHDRTVATVFYYNSVLDWNMYDMHQKMLQNPDYWLRVHGKVVRIPGDKSFPQPKDGMLVFDFAQADVRAFWISECINATQSGYVDGCFSDRATSSNANWGSAYAAGHLLVHQELQKQLGPNGILIANHAYDMPGVNAVQIESFKADEASIALLNNSAMLGKIVEAHAGYGEDGRDDHCADITNSLAAFLIAANERSFFGCSRGWRIQTDPVNHAWHPQFDKKLGPPLGPAVKTGNVWHRSFAAGVTVSFNTKTNAGNITWAD